MSHYTIHIKLNHKWSHIFIYLSIHGIIVYSYESDSDDADDESPTDIDSSDDLHESQKFIQNV